MYVHPSNIKHSVEWCLLLTILGMKRCQEAYPWQFISMYILMYFAAIER